MTGSRDRFGFWVLAFAGVAARVTVGLRSRATGVARLEISLC